MPDNSRIRQTPDSSTMLLQRGLAMCCKFQLRHGGTLRSP